ncbi:hypothetical protein ACFYO9_37360 [Streptomyces sp. NPDC005863]|uniref:hypothetical protein n=1 Tax=Streptomyces sp. NPDC005863 TaxID=3364735 RepID=UPI0036ADE3C8
MFGRKTAEKLDDAAAALYRAGKRVGGERGGRVGDAVASATLDLVRGRIGVDCTRCARGTCEETQPSRPVD